MAQVNKEEVSPDLDALLVCGYNKRKPRDQYKRICHFSYSKRRVYVLRTSEDLLDLMHITTGTYFRMYSHWLPRISHLTETTCTTINSVLQPCTATRCAGSGSSHHEQRSMVPGMRDGRHTCDRRRGSGTVYAGSRQSLWARTV